MLDADPTPSTYRATDICCWSWNDCICCFKLSYPRRTRPYVASRLPRSWRWCSPESVICRLYLARVLRHWKAKPLPGSQIFSGFVSCRPWGQGSFALQVLGSSLLQLSTKFPSFRHGQSSGILLTSDSLLSIGFFSIIFSLLLWGQGTFWWFLPVCRVSHPLFKHMRGCTRLKFSVSA